MNTVAPNALASWIAAAMFRLPAIEEEKIERVERPAEKAGEESVALIAIQRTKDAPGFHERLSNGSSRSPQSFSCSCS